jgi:hemin uptake protein HemP
MTDARSTPAAAARPAPRIRVSSDEMFRGQREIVIVHGGREYLLRITKSDKLILTK